MSEETEPIAQPQPAAAPSAETASYKKVVKNTAVYGSSQVVQMLVTLIRAKFVAVILGSAGIGINAIIQSSLMLIGTLSSFGIFQSSVRDISQAFVAADGVRLSRVKQVMQRLIAYTGVLGLAICLLGSPLLSRFAFGDSDSVWLFVLLSLAFPFMALSNGDATLLQGTRNLGYLAKGSVWGSLGGLAVAIPLYIWCGVYGIVLSIVANYVILYWARRHFVRKIDFEPLARLSRREVVLEGRPMIGLGTALMLGTLSIWLFTYLTNITISRLGSINDLGFFQSASSITTQSIVVIIAVLSADFYPRLAGVCEEQTQVDRLMNQQVELVLLMMAPIVAGLILFAPLIVRILLNAEFLVIVPMMRWMTLSLLLRGVWLTMSYVILAKGDRRTYFVYDALLGNGTLFVFNVCSYWIWGLSALGISYLIGTIVVTVALVVIVHKKYGVTIRTGFYRYFFLFLAGSVAMFLIVRFAGGWIGSLAGGFILVAVVGSSLLLLNKRTDLFALIGRKLRR